jgi:hypothetical protein
MVKLFLIALASLISFFVFVGLAYRVTGNSDYSAWVAVLLGFIGVPIVLFRLWDSSNRKVKCPDGNGLYPECLFVVSVDATEIVVTRPNGQVERLALSEINEVAIVTNDSGPWGTDVWWYLLGRNEKSGCVFPGGATGENMVLEMVQQLPGFNNEVFIQAMGSTSNARFTCWRANADKPFTGVIEKL